MHTIRTKYPPMVTKLVNTHMLIDNNVKAQQAANLNVVLQK